MASPARFKGGVNNAIAGSTLGMFGAMDPGKYHTFFDDFNAYTAGDWTITTTEAGAGDATEALTTADGGILLITNDAADNDLDYLQKVGTVFQMAAGKKAWFKARFKVSDATQSDINIGLEVIDTTPGAVTDGIWFRKDDGDALIDFICQKDDSAGKTTAAGIATLVDDTYVTLGWYYNGVGAVEAFVNDAKVATLNATSSYLPDTMLAVSFGLMNGEAVVKTMSIDYIFAAKER